MAQPVVGASDAPAKLVRRKTASTKISEQEDMLLSLVAERCGETRSTIISQAIRSLLVQLLKGDGGWRLPEESAHLAGVLDVLERESKSFIEKCKSRI